MKTLRISLYSVTIAVIGFLYSGCIDDPVMPLGNYVSGSIYDIYGSKYELGLRDKFFISPGNAPITITTDDFRINTFGNPYDLVITSYASDFVIKYEDINLSYVKPVFNNPESSPIQNWFVENVDILIPRVQNRCIVYILFLSNELSYQITYQFELNGGDVSVPVQIFSASMNAFMQNSIGFMYLETNDWNSYTEIEYNKFGIIYRDSILSDEPIEFREQDIAYNPVEAMTVLNNVRPVGTSRGRSKISLILPGENKNSDLVLLDDIPDYTVMPLPILPISDYRIKYTGSYKGEPFNEYGFKYIYIDPGQNAEIIHNVPVQLVTPSNDDSIINGSTVFGIRDDNTPGVFKYVFKRYDNTDIKYLDYFTTSRTLTFSEISARGFEWKPNCRYYWWVYKLPGYENVDSILSTHYLLDNRYNSVQLSQIWTFKTGP